MTTTSASSLVKAVSHVWRACLGQRPADRACKHRLDLQVWLLGRHVWDRVSGAQSEPNLRQNEIRRWGIAGPVADKPGPYRLDAKLAVARRANTNIGHLLGMEPQAKAPTGDPEVPLVAIPVRRLASKRCRNVSGQADLVNSLIALY